MRPLPEGGTEGDALRKWKLRTGKDHPEAVPPIDCPSSIAYLWKWFWSLNAGRAIGAMGGVLPIPPSEILAWGTLQDIRFERWELDALFDLDRVYLKMVNATQATKTD